MNGKEQKTKFKRSLAKISRWLHIYLSMVSFAIVLFFSVTGLTLNHAEKFQGAAHTEQVKGKLDTAWVNSKDTAYVAKLTVAEYFRNRYSVKGAVSDFRIDDDQVNIAYKGPGYEADAFINRKTGEYELLQTSAGLIGFFNDLHKGRDSGKAWSWIIDISAILMVLISLTGLILLLFIKRKRVNGMVLLAAGLLFVYLFYHFWGQ